MAATRTAPPRARFGYGLACLALVALALVAAGCRRSGDEASLGDRGVTVDRQLTEELLEGAIDNLNRLWEFSVNADQMLRQIIEQLNSWLSTRQLAPDWQPDALVEGLAPRYRELDEVQALGADLFPLDDQFHFQEVLWLRNVARATVGQEWDDLVRAERLFDWTVRNLQLAADDDPSLPLMLAYQSMLLGRGSAADRAGVFVLLARQQRLDAVLLALPNRASNQAAVADDRAPGDGESESSESPESREPSGLREPSESSALDESGELSEPSEPSGLREPSESSAADESDEPGEPALWAVGVWIGGEIYLFDPRLGLPLPGPQGQGIATLAQVVADDAILRQLDVEGTPYPVTAADARQAVALIEASPGYLARRMQVLQSRLAGEQRMVLTIEPSRLAAQLQATGLIADVRIWERPYAARLAQADPENQQRLTRELLRFRAELLPEGLRGASRALEHGRVLYLNGSYVGERAASHYYQQARPADSQIAAAQLNEAIEQIVRGIKEDGSYWLGLALFEGGRYQVATDYFLTRTLEAFPAGYWSEGARYNLGRCYEALGRLDEAAALYAASNSPQRHGDRLRANRLEQELAAHVDADAEPGAASSDE